MTGVTILLYVVGAVVFELALGVAVGKILKGRQ